MTMTEDEAKAVLDELVAKDEKGRKVILLYNSMQRDQLQVERGAGRAAVLGDEPGGGGPSAPVLGLAARPHVCEPGRPASSVGAGAAGVGICLLRVEGMLRAPAHPPRAFCCWSWPIRWRTRSPDRLAAPWATRSAPGARSPSCPKVRRGAARLWGAEARLPEAAVRPRGAYRVPAAAGSELGGVAAV